jgi:NAD+ kinase
MFMKTLGVIANCRKESAGRVLTRLRERAAGAGITLFPDAATCELMNCPCALDGPAVFDQVEAVMVLGGDGTMLRAVRALEGRDLPVIGVNLGSLGFMTSVAESDLDRAVDCLARGEFGVSKRVVLECNARSAISGAGHYRALNDVVITSVHSRVVTLSVRVDDSSVGDFVCDGLILSTPTGSTGHSLSAGGPVIMPEAGALVVSLICPHTLSTRPLVLPDEVIVEVTVTASAGKVALTADGQIGQELAQGDRVEIRRASRHVRFIHLPGYSYFGVLRQKLHWRGSNV